LNFANALSRRFNYKGKSTLNIKLLSTLQNKLVFWNAIAKPAYRREVAKALTSVFLIIKIKIVISKKEPRLVQKTVYNKAQRPIKILIRDLQIYNL